MSTAGNWTLEGDRPVCDVCGFDVLQGCECDWRCQSGCLARETDGPHRIEILPGMTYRVCGVCDGKDPATGEPHVFHCVCPEVCPLCERRHGGECPDYPALTGDEIPF